MSIDTYYMLEHRANDVPLVSLGTWECHFGYPGSVTDLDHSPIARAPADRGRLTCADEAASWPKSAATCPPRLNSVR